MMLIDKLPRRFLEAIEVDIHEGCWNWLAGKDRHGYGYFSLDGRDQKAHRVSYEIMIGKIPDGFHLHHVCKNPACVNPDHLRPLSPKAHSRTRAKWHCPKGHPYERENLYFDRRRQKICRTCRSEYDARRYRESLK